MKITVTTKAPARKLVAVIGIGGRGYFVRDGDKSRWICGSFGCTSLFNYPLEDTAVLSGRTPVYEGDELTIQF